MTTLLALVATAATLGTPSAFYDPAGSGSYFGYAAALDGDFGIVDAPGAIVSGPERAAAYLVHV